MMETFIHRLFSTLFLVLFSLALFAQEKNQSYYYRHQNEILPDANEAFQKGDYDRAIDICLWHYIIVGDKAADSLREKAERCSQLSKEMADLQAAGKTKEAVETAKTLLSFNPNDTAAKELLMEIEEASTPIPVDTVVVEDVPVVDTPVTEQPIQIEPPVEEGVLEPVQPREINASVTDMKGEPMLQPRPRFVVKAGASFLDMKQLAQTIAPGGSFGIYDIGGTPIGVEAGFYLCPGISDKSASLFGLDASLVFRAANGIYPKAGLGFFTCNSTEGVDAETRGLCAGLGLTFLVGGHLCLEIGAKYYPKVSIQNFEKVTTTAGISYDFPATTHILSSGIAPFVSIGWAF